MNLICDFSFVKRIKRFLWRKVPSKRFLNLSLTSKSRDMVFETGEIPKRNLITFLQGNKYRWASDPLIQFFID